MEADGQSRRLTVAIKALREEILRLPSKKINILSDWLVKWSTLLKKESESKPYSFKKYKQREIILVDFGFNIDGEFGGRHYAVVLEKENNPSSQVVLVAPITSYDPAKGEKPHPSNVDLGVGAIHDYEKGAAVVLNQIRAISKMRIESPTSSFVKRIYLETGKFDEVCEKLRARIFLD